MTTVTWEALTTTDAVSWAADPNNASTDLPGQRAWLPIPGTGDAGKVPTVNDEEDGYELAVQAGGGPDPTDGTDGQVWTTDGTVGSWTDLPAGGSGAAIPVAGVHLGEVSGGDLVVPSATLTCTVFDPTLSEYLTGSLTGTDTVTDGDAVLVVREDNQVAAIYEASATGAWTLAATQPAEGDIVVLVGADFGGDFATIYAGQGWVIDSDLHAHFTTNWQGVAAVVGAALPQEVGVLRDTDWLGSGGTFADGGTTNAPAGNGLMVAEGWGSPGSAGVTYELDDIDTIGEGVWCCLTRNADPGTFSGPVVIDAATNGATILGAGTLTLDTEWESITLASSVDPNSGDKVWQVVSYFSGSTSTGGGGDITTDPAWAAKGDLIVGTGNDTASVLTVGANGTIPTAASGETTGILWERRRRPGWSYPSAGNVETVHPAMGVTNQSVLTSGRVVLVSILLERGEAVASITFVSSTTAGASLTHQWFALCDADCVVLAVSADDTSTAWGSSTAKTLAMGTTYTITTPGRYRLACMVEAGTVPSLRAATTGAAQTTVTINGNTGLTTPPAVGTDLNSGTSVGLSAIPYAYVS